MSTSTARTTTPGGHGATPPSTETAREVGGWRFSCHKAPAMSSAQREKLAAELRLRPAIPLPEVVFVDNTLQIDHPASGLTIHFDAKEALHRWMLDHEGAVYAMSINGNHRRLISPTGAEADAHTSYTGTVTQGGRSLDIARTSETLPLDKLQQEVAILFYDRVLLFEDDIRDLGEIYVEVRVRVMEFGFLLLCRYYCRIDDKQTLKLQDTRYYHEFGDDFVWRDHELRESTIADIKRVGSRAGVAWLVARADLHHGGTQVLSARDRNQQDAPVDLSGDVVYGILRPVSKTTTEKIHLVISS
ncbi:hypothetical protein PHYPSEUDO_014490 [Phytophthora pseudosyringae]|uniref:TIP41-like protein n=1 Tax=Phytophthora pseudosyringae TaxID=221518 RepID=A0A8T1W1V6_9STRA|nr:hypothetical protein PHYPSEUDO_014490 [Phytophthora pseudosyringae]